MWKPLSKWERIEKLLYNDHEIYPTEHPVTIEIAKEWFQRYPECAAAFESESREEEWANVLVVPLSRLGWELILNAKYDFRESDFKDKYLYNPNQHEIAFHFYHVEKHRDRASSSFRLYNSLKSYVNDHLCKNIFSNCKVLGFSAYCVTNDGIRFFGKQLGFKAMDAFEVVVNGMLISPQLVNSMEITQTCHLMYKIGSRL